jgi:hypothetical protein
LKGTVNHPQHRLLATERVIGLGASNQVPSFSAARRDVQGGGHCGTSWKTSRALMKSDCSPLSLLYSIIPALSPS